MGCQLPGNLSDASTTKSFLLPCFLERRERAATTYLSLDCARSLPVAHVPQSEQSGRDRGRKPHEMVNMTKRLPGLTGCTRSRKTRRVQKQHPTAAYGLAQGTHQAARRVCSPTPPTQAQATDKAHSTAPGWSPPAKLYPLIKLSEGLLSPPPIIPPPPSPSPPPRNAASNWLCAT